MVALIQPQKELMFHLRAAYDPPIVRERPARSRVGKLGDPPVHVVDRLEEEWRRFHHGTSPVSVARRTLQESRGGRHPAALRVLRDHYDREDADRAYVELLHEPGSGWSDERGDLYCVPGLSPLCGDVIDAEFGKGPIGEVGGADVKISGVFVGASADTIQSANEILQSLADLNDSARQIALAVMNLESGFGVSGTWVLKDGTKTYNAGAITCNASRKGTAGCFRHGDVTAEGEPTEYSFMMFNTMREGIQAFMGTWGKTDTLAAAERGDAHAVASAMYGHHYFTGSKGSDADRIDLYANGIMGSSRSVAAALGESVAVSPGGIATMSSDGVAWWKYAAVGLLVSGIGVFAVMR